MWAQQEKDTNDSDGAGDGAENDILHHISLMLTHTVVTSQHLSPRVKIDHARA